MKQLISVIIPTYRRPEFLKSSIESVEKAWVFTGKDECKLEVIVIDDGHDETTHQVCQECENSLGVSVRYQCSVEGPSAGPSAARNQGVKIANGEYIYLLDDDDQFLKNRFSKSLKMLLDGDCDVVMERTLRVYVDGSERPSYITGPVRFDQEPFYSLLGGGPSSHVTPGATSFAKSIFQHCGGYDENIRYGEDGELLLRLCLSGRVSLLGGEPVCRVSIHAKNASDPMSLDYWMVMAARSCLYEKVRKGSWYKEKKYLEEHIAGKLDFALTKIRYEASSYSKRISRGLKCLYYFPYNCFRYNNFKTICVWLLKSNKS